MTDDLDILRESVDVEPTAGSRPRASVVIVAVVLLGIIATLVGALLISAVVAVLPVVRVLYFP